MLASPSSRTRHTSFQALLPIEIPDPVDPPPGNPAESKRSEVGASRGSGFGLLAAVCPPALIDGIIDECGRRERRLRRLPARLTVYALLFMCLHPWLSYQKLVCHLAEMAPLGGTLLNKSSFIRARQRLGVEVLKRLFHATAGPLAEPRAAGCWWRGRRLMALDGSTVELPATPALDAAFGGPRGPHSARSGLPRAQVVALIECGTRALCDAAIGAYGIGELELTKDLLPSIQPGMLLLADRGFYGRPLWEELTVRRGVDLLWRVQEVIGSSVIAHLEDGSYLARANRASDAPVIRIIEYVVAASEEPVIYRLATNLLDPDTAPARELAELYAERWEIETHYNEFKTTQCAGAPLRSQTVDGVEQEFWAHCVLYQCGRRLAYAAAMETEERDCDRISFSGVLDTMRRGVRWLGGMRGAPIILRRAAGQLAVKQARIERRDRKAPRIVRYFGHHRFPARATYPGPRSIKAQRRPDVVICALPG